MLFSKKIRNAILLMLVLAMTSCGKENAETDSTIPDSNPVVQETEAETEDPYKDDLPEGLDFEGYDFRILTFEDGNLGEYAQYIDINEVTGELVNDAAFERNNRVEERLNVNITLTEQGIHGATAELIKTSVTAGLDEYDYATLFSNDQGTFSLVTTNSVYNYNELEYIDLSKPYYLKSLKDTFTIFGKLYYLTGDFMFSAQGGVFTWRNLELWEEYGLEDPYPIVRAGEWTLEKCFSMIEGTYTDLNGNGTRDVEDRYGINGIPITLAYCYHSGNGEYFRLTEDGYELTVDSERNVNMVDALLECLNDPDGYFIWDDSYGNMFQQGRSLLYLGGSSTTLLRDLDFSAGILPHPKFDDSQEEYRSMIVGGITVVPVTITNPERTGIVIEALFSESVPVKEAFIKEYVENKTLQDEGSQEIFKMSMENAAYDATYYLDPSGLISNRTLFTQQLEKNQNNLVSDWAKIKQRVEKLYAQTFEELQ